MVTAAPPASLFVELDTGPDVAASLGSGLRIFAELSVPAGGAPDLLLVCLPGGGMNRHYFNLPTPDGETTASFAAAMAGKGFAVAMLDPLGIGDSGKPEDAYALTPDMHVRALVPAIDVPVLLAYGDKDLFGPPQEIVRYYPRCNDIGLLILPETRHNHFIYPTRKTLFDRFAQWTQNL